MGIESRIRNAWQGRISGCMLGKPIEVFSMQRGYDAVQDYLKRNDALPTRDYIPLDESEDLVNRMAACCRGNLTRSEPDDDIHYSVLSLMMLEEHGADLSTRDVAMAWLKNLPVAATFTAERAAYRILLERGEEWFPERGDPGFDLSECSDNPYNDWIGAQIRTDVYGWVTPGMPDIAKKLAMADASLSHRGDGVLGAVFVSVAGSLIPISSSLQEAIEASLAFIDRGSGARAAIEMGMREAGNPGGGKVIRDFYEGMSPVHTLNNLALVVWALLSNPDDFSAAIGDVVAEGLDTDCNGATVGALWALQDRPIPDHWIEPWQGRVGVGLAGQSELSLDDLVERTLKVESKLRSLQS